MRLFFRDVELLVVASATEAANKTDLDLPPLQAQACIGIFPSSGYCCNFAPCLAILSYQLKRDNNIYSSSKCCYLEERCTFRDLHTIDRFSSLTSSNAKLMCLRALHIWQGLSFVRLDAAGIYTDLNAKDRLIKIPGKR